LGGVYENVLFFPVVQMLKDRYPGVLVDVVASARGKQVYEMCKNVRYANVYDPDDDWPEPTEPTTPTRTGRSPPSTHTCSVCRY